MFEAVQAWRKSGRIFLYIAPFCTVLKLFFIFSSDPMHIQMRPLQSPSAEQNRERWIRYHAGSQKIYLLKRNSNERKNGVRTIRIINILPIGNFWITVCSTFLLMSLKALENSRYAGCTMLSHYQSYVWNSTESILYQFHSVICSCAIVIWVDPRKKYQVDLSVCFQNTTGEFHLCERGFKKSYRTIGQKWFVQIFGPFQGQQFSWEAV